MVGRQMKNRVTDIKLLQSQTGEVLSLNQYVNGPTNGEGSSM